MIENKPAAGILYREAGRPDAPAVVLLHGIGSTSAGWREQFAPLGERYRVIAWTAPGYHESAPLPAEHPAADDYAAALARLLDALHVEQAHLATNSWGTLVGLAFAARYPQRARSLVLGGPSAGSHGLTLEERARRTAERIARIRGLGPAEMRKQDVDRLFSRHASPELRASVADNMGEYPTPEGYAQAARMLYATDGVELIRPLSQPVLVVSGTEDVVTPPETNARRLAAAARDARFLSIEGCGHLPHLEAASRFNAALAEFFG